MWPFARRGATPELPAEDLFDEAFLRRLESLAIVARRTVDGKTRAERRSKKTGAGIELADTRPYTPGDDFRAIDWSLYARSERLHTRLFEEEEDLSVYVVLDVSASMTLGTPPKLDHAKRLAAALAYVSLASLDRVSITTFSDRVVARVPALRGKARIFRVLDLLRHAETGGATDLGAAMRQFVAQNKRRGVVLVVSDLYDPKSFETGIDALRYGRFEPRILHLVDRRDAEPELFGDVVLVDRETGEQREVTVTEAVLRRFREAHERHGKRIAAFAGEKHVPLVSVDVSERWDDAVLGLLRRGGILVSFELAGWSAGAGIAFAITAFLVTLLYLLALRRRPIEVPFVHLWREALTEERSSQLFSRLKRIFSWLLALLFVALVALALADPRAHGHAGSERLVVIALDVSASMGATDVVPERMSVARERARSIVRGLGASDRALVVAMGAEPRPVSPATSDHAQLIAAIDALEPLDVVADLARTAQLAADVSADAASRELVVVSDGAVTGVDRARAILENAQLPTRHDRIGSDGGDLALTALSVRRYPLDPSRNEVLLEVTSASAQDEDVEVQLLGDGETVDVVPMTIPSHGRVRRFFQDLTGVDRALEARLTRADGTRDALAADDRFFARVPPRRRVRVVVVSEDDIYLEAALLLDEYLEVHEIAPATFPPSDPFDVAIFDRFVPSVSVDADAIWIDPVPAEGVRGPLEITGTMERPFFDRLRREDPLLRHAALSDVNVARALAVRPSPDDTVVAADTRGPLLISGTRGDHHFVALTFDIRESDLPLRPAFPLLLLDAIDSFAPTDAAYRGSVETGVPANVAIPPGATEAFLVDGSTRTRLPITDGLAAVRFDRAGFHTIETDAGELVVAANLAAASELDLTPRDLDLGAAPPSDTLLRAEAARLPWQWLALAALLLLLVEWVTFHRRWTV